MTRPFECQKCGKRISGTRQVVELWHMGNPLLEKSKLPFVCTATADKGLDGDDMEAYVLRVCNQCAVSWMKAIEHWFKE